MNRLDSKRRTQVIAALVEGNSLRGTARMTGVARMTVEKLLREVGAVCSQYQDEHLRNLQCKRIECDEIWSFVLCKQKNVPADKQGQFGIGDVWTWTAIDSESKLVPSWRIGARDLGTAYDFMHDLADRLANRVQLTTDGHRPYLEAVESAFGLEIDYAVLRKIYGSARRPKSDTARPNALGAKPRSSQATRIGSTSARASWSGRICRFE